MDISEKKVLQYLFTKKILTKEQINSYLHMNPKPPLLHWLRHYKIVNEVSWNKIMRELTTEAKTTQTTKTEPLAMPNSFAMPSPKAEKTMILPENSSIVSEFSVTKEMTFSDTIQQHRKFHHYEIQEQVGSGGMGVVYKAIDTLSRRTVALKLLRKNLTTEHEVKRFEIEGQATAQLNHPNIVEIYELGQAPMPYLAMEFVEGNTLKEFISEQKLKHRDIADIFRQIAEGLDYAHQKGIIHRDIKPANIVITSKKQAKIMDFGLAKDTNVDNSLSRTGDIVGTPQYLPPEQARGIKVDARADIYSLGGTLYHLLTGQPPFSGDSYMSLFYDIIHVSPTPLRKINNTISADLATICMKCLEKNPDFRYQRAKDLAQDLQNYIERKPINANQGRLYRWNKRILVHIYQHQILWLLIALNMIAALFIFKPFSFSFAEEKMPFLFHGITPRILEYDNNLPAILDYYNIKIAEIKNGKKNPKWVELHEEQAKLYYSLRKTNKEYLRNALVSYQETEFSSLKEVEKFLQILICSGVYNEVESYEKLEIMANKILLQGDFIGKFSVVYPYKKICDFYRNNNQEEIETIQQHPYGLWALAQKETDTLKKEQYLRQALLLAPKEENFYLALMDIYKTENCYDAVEILYPPLHKLNSHLVEQETFTEDKQQDNFYLLYLQMHMLENFEKNNAQIWEQVYRELKSEAESEQNSKWKRFVAHNHILRLLASQKISGKSAQYVTQKMHEHFAAANTFVANHYLSFIYVGNFYYSQQKWVDALVYWDQAKFYFSPCSDWLATCENIVMKKIMDEEKKLEK